MLHPLFKEAEFNLWNIFMVMCFTVWFSTLRQHLPYFSVQLKSAVLTLFGQLKSFCYLRHHPSLSSSHLVCVCKFQMTLPCLLLKQTRWTIMHNYTILHTELLYTLSSITWEICAAFLTGKNWAALQARWRHGVGQRWRSCSVMLHWVSGQTHI